MRLKSKIIRINYADRDILSPGGHLAAENYGGSRAFTTTAESLLEAASPAVRAYGNAQGSMSVPICQDFASEPEALEAAFAAEEHAEAHQEGVLSFTVGDKTRKWSAGVTGFNWSINYAWTSTPNSRGCVRLTLSYEFILGAKLQE